MPRRRREPPADAGPGDTSRARTPVIPHRARPPAPPDREASPAGTTPGLSARDEAVALAIATGATLADAARRSGAGRRTVYDIVRRPEVAARINALRRELMAEAMSRLVGLAGEAVDTMADLMRDASGEVAPAVRLWAAQSVLAQTLRLMEHVSVSDELADVHRQLQALKPR